MVADLQDLDLPGEDSWKEAELRGRRRISGQESREVPEPKLEDQGCLVGIGLPTLLGSGTVGFGRKDP